MQRTSVGGTRGSRGSPTPSRLPAQSKNTRRTSAGKQDLPHIQTPKTISKTKTNLLPAKSKSHILDLVPFRGFFSILICRRGSSDAFTPTTAEETALNRVQHHVGHPGGPAPGNALDGQRLGDRGPFWRPVHRGGRVFRVCWPARGARTLPQLVSPRPARNRTQLIASKFLTQCGGHGKRRNIRDPPF